MKISTRLAIILTTITLIPVSILGFGSAQVSEQYITQNITDLQSSTADGLAMYVDTWLFSQIRAFQSQATSLELVENDPNLLSAYANLLIRQNPNLEVLSLVDNDDIEYIPSVYTDEPTFISFRRRLSKLAYSPPSISIGTPYLDGKKLFLPLRVPTQNESIHISALVNLDTIKKKLESIRYGSLGVALLDKKGDLLCTSDPALVGGAKDIVKNLKSDLGFSDIRFNTDAGESAIAAISPVPRFGWNLLVISSADVIQEPVSAITNRTGFIASITILAAGLIGTIFLQPITQSLLSLSQAANQLMLGRYEHQIPLTGDDELQQLAQTFNQMSTALLHSQQEILRKNKEIQQANEILQQRVEERTKALRDTQAQLIQSAKLAAVGELGAGMAHALNNPISSILGMAQIIRHQTPESQISDSIVDEARRCREIITQWRGITTAPQDESPNGVIPCDLHILLQNAAETALPYLQQRGVQVELQFTESPMWCHCQPSSMGSAFVQLFFALRPHLPINSQMRISLSLEGDSTNVNISHPEHNISNDEQKAAAMYYWSAIQQFAMQGAMLSESKSDICLWTIRIPTDPTI